jgi:hypothetical protein
VGAGVPGRGTDCCGAGVDAIGSRKAVEGGAGGISVEW